jgi:hypothetical protein
MDKKIKSYIKDTYINLKTRTLLHDHNGMSNGEKQTVYNVLKYLATREKPIFNHESQYSGGNFITSDLTNIIKSSSNYDDIKNKIEGCKTDECLMAHAILAYHIDPKSLLMLTTAIHTRVKPMLNDGKNGWFDNFSLNSYLYQLTTFVYEDFEDNDSSTYTIAKPKTNLINESNKLTNPNDLLFHLGNLYRCFKEFGIGTKEEIYKLSHEEAVSKLDDLNEKYPYYTYQCHGCDVFDISDRSCSISDIKEFCDRYPNSIVGGILNTETYASGKGQHWVCLLFRDSTVYLMCSQAGDFSSFHDQGKLLKQLTQFGFGQKYNSETIQKDGSNCGLYSTLFNLVSIIQLDKINNKTIGQNMNGGKLIRKHSETVVMNTASKIPKLDISEIVKQIGINAEIMHSQGIFQLKNKLIGWNLD